MVPNPHIIWVVLHRSYIREPTSEVLNTAAGGGSGGIFCGILEHVVKGVPLLGSSQCFG